MKKLTILILLAILQPLKAEEGMWIPMLLKKYNIEEMHKLGFKLQADDVYSVNQSSLKDAVVIFGRGCTGELVSDQGLLFTNHHCGYDQIQNHSDVNHDYLTNGFWAMNRSEELPNPGLTVTFLVRMEEVTQAVLSGIPSGLPDEETRSRISQRTDSLQTLATKGTHYQAVVKPFFNGNQYFLFVNEVFQDVRLVGAPPSAIGKFGGDTDNWMWPRHTGDFSVFRIYADKNNKPAPYSPDNVPYRPRKHFSISTKGVQPGDFTMVFGYPGSTYQYVPSYHLQMLTETINPKLIELRGLKLDILNRYQNADAKVRIQYASKNASASNTWKKWIGEIRGLAILDAINRKKRYEKEFQQWTSSPESTGAEYAPLLGEYQKRYTQYIPYRLASDYLTELLFRGGIETIEPARALQTLVELYESPAHPSDETLAARRSKCLNRLKEFYKDYAVTVDRDLTEAMLQVYRQNIPQSFLPPVYAEIDRKFKGSIPAYVAHLFEKSLLTNPSHTLLLVENWSNQSASKSIDLIRKDPAFQLMQSTLNYFYNDIFSETGKLRRQIEELDRQYMAAQMAFEPQKRFYPDANFTLRVSYGQVNGYNARDGVTYLHETTLQGIMEKDNPEIYDYRVPEKLKELYRTKDFGHYAFNQTVPVCFVATNHTTGGNSGSPVLNANGELVGINFDRAWEGVMSDLMYNPDQCRNISLDVRYVLFVIDKFAGAGYLIDEMTLLN